MEIISGVRALKAPLNRSILTIGNFDGVHLGHVALIARVLELAQKHKAISVLTTFEPHPVKVLYPERALKRLFPIEDQCRRLEALGLEVMIIEPFSREFSQLSPERFIMDWIFRPLNPLVVVVGYDFTFGANKGGSIEVLKAYGQKLGFEVEVIAPLKVDATLVSSSRIRQDLASGDVISAERLLGRPFRIHGIVEKGAGRGRTIGIPTANLRYESEIVPKEGVYAGYASFEGQRHLAVANIGRNVTFTAGAHPVSLEIHVLDYSGDLYGDEMAFEFKIYLRDEMKFPGAAELVTQIHKDIAIARDILK